MSSCNSASILVEIYKSESNIALFKRLLSIESIVVFLFISSAKKLWTLLWDNIIVGINNKNAIRYNNLQLINLSFV